MGRRQFGSVRRLPSGRWQVRYYNLLGERVTAPRTFEAKADAHRWLVVVEADQLRGTYIDPGAGQTSFARWSEQWLASRPDKRATSIARDRAALRAHLTPALGALPLAAITPTHVGEVVGAMRAAGLAPSTIRTYVATLAAAFNAAVAADLIPRSPVRGIHLERSSRRERPTLSPEQILALVGEVPGQFRALVLLGAVLGLRWSEATGLRLGDVDIDAEVIHVRQTIEEVRGRVRVVEATKTDASRRTIAAPSLVLDAIARHIEHHRPGASNDDLVFVGSRGGPLRRSFVARVLRPAASRAGLPAEPKRGIDFHGLRHVATSLMVCNGEHPKVMQSRLGHASPRLTLGLYAHVPVELDRAVARRLDAFLVDARPLGHPGQMLWDNL
jgi:integrase